MQPLSRRQVLLLSGIGSAAMVTGAAGLLWGQAATTRMGEGEGFEEPEALRSADGQLDEHLTVDQTPVRLGSHDHSVLSYDGSLPGPTLMVHPGEHNNPILENQPAQATKLHVHGQHHA